MKEFPLVWKFLDRYKNHIILPGPLHPAMNYIGIITGYKFRGTSNSDILPEARLLLQLTSTLHWRMNLLRILSKNSIEFEDMCILIILGKQHSSVLHLSDTVISSSCYSMQSTQTIWISSTGVMADPFFAYDGQNVSM